MTNIEGFALGPGSWLWPWAIVLAILIAVIATANITVALWERKRDKTQGTVASARRTADVEALDENNDRPDSHRRAA